MPTPPQRVRLANEAPVHADREYVLYWMTALRRPRWNFALDRALEIADELSRPLVVLEALRSGYRWANDRHHHYVLDGMADNREAFAGTSVRYYPFVETPESPGPGLLAALSERACAVVTDDYPCFFLPRMLTSAAEQLDVRLEAVDGNGLLPIEAPEKAFARAYDFRRYLHRELVPHLGEIPTPEPLAKRQVEGTAEEIIPRKVLERWPEASASTWLASDRDLSGLAIDHSVPPPLSLEVTARPSGSSRSSSGASNSTAAIAISPPPTQRAGSLPTSTTGTSHLTRFSPL